MGLKLYYLFRGILLSELGHGFSHNLKSGIHELGAGSHVGREGLKIYLRFVDWTREGDKQRSAAWGDQPRGPVLIGLHSNSNAGNHKVLMGLYFLGVL